MDIGSLVHALEEEGTYMVDNKEGADNCYFYCLEALLFQAGRLNLLFYHFFRLSSLFKIAHSLLVIFSDYTELDNCNFGSILLIFVDFVDHLSLTIFTIKFIIEVISKSISEWFFRFTQS